MMDTILFTIGEHLVMSIDLSFLLNSHALNMTLLTGEMTCISHEQFHNAVIVNIQLLSVLLITP
jgi:hypothetical protein